MRRTLTYLCGLLAMGSSQAHDLWLEPSRWDVADGQPVSLTLRIGEGFKGDSLPYIPEWFEHFTVFVGADEAPAPGRLGDDPALALPLPGGGVVLYESKPDFVELGAEKFAAYLHEQGLEPIVAERERRGEAAATAGEFYSRCAKIVLAGPGAASLRRPSGCRIEFIAGDDTLVRGANGPLTLRLEFAGQPLAGVLVRAYRRAEPDKILRLRSDAGGRVVLDGLPAGEWFVGAVHMVREQRGRAQWRSWWASLTFHLP